MTLYPRGVEILRALSSGGGGSTGDLAKGFLALSCRGVGGSVDGRLITVRKSGGGTKGKEATGKVIYDLVADAHAREIMASSSESLPSLSTNTPSPSPSPNNSPDHSPLSSKKSSKTAVSSLASFHRNHLLELLATYLPSSSIHFNTRLVSYAPSSADGSNTINLQFSNGTSATCDVVFGCDGLYSVIRNGLINGYRFPSSASSSSPSPPKDVFWTGSSLFKTNVPISKVKTHFPHHSALNGAQIVCLSFSFILSFLFTTNDGTLSNYNLHTFIRNYHVHPSTLIRIY